MTSATEQPRANLPPTTQPSYRVGVSTHPGARESNEDACATAETDTCSVLIVADGAGGHAGGEVASEIVASEIAAYFNANRTAPPGAASVRGALKAAQAAVRAEIQRTAKYHDMRSTALVVAATRSRAWVGHVGDSRAYLVRDGKAQQLTRDDTLVQTLVEVGEIDAEQARTHSKANVLLQSIGDPRTLDYHVSDPIEVGVGDTIVACSDGLAEILRDDEIGRLASGEGSSNEVASRLVKRAVEGGATDNVTVGVIRWLKPSKRPSVSAQGRVVKKRRGRRTVTPFRVAIGAVIVAAAVIGVAGVRRQRAIAPVAANPMPPRPNPARVVPSELPPPPAPEPVRPAPPPPEVPAPAVMVANDDAAAVPSATVDAEVTPAAPPTAPTVAPAPAETPSASAITDAGAAPANPAAVAPSALGGGEDAAATGTLYLRGLPPDATVWINQVAATPDAQGAVAIPSGRRVLVRIHQHGHQDQNESVRVEPGHSTAIHVDLATPHSASHGSSGGSGRSGAGAGANGGGSSSESGGGGGSAGASHESGGGGGGGSAPANPF